jgi:hypothetical protein
MRAQTHLPLQVHQVQAHLPHQIHHVNRQGHLEDEEYLKE